MFFIVSIGYKPLQHRCRCQFLDIIRGRDVAIFSLTSGDSNLAGLRNLGLVSDLVPKNDPNLVPKNGPKMAQNCEKMVQKLNQKSNQIGDARQGRTGVGDRNLRFFRFWSEIIFKPKFTHPSGHRFFNLSEVVGHVFDTKSGHGFVTRIGSRFWRDF